MNRIFWRFVSGALALVVAAVGVLYLVERFRYWRSPEYGVERGLKELERQYREDKYGGDTPEETLRLFIDALKKGDIELASKYFALEEQNKWTQELSEIKKKNALQFMIPDLLRAKKSRQESDQAFFTVVNEKDVVTVLIDMRKGINGRWKIIDL